VSANWSRNTTPHAVRDSAPTSLSARRLALPVVGRGREYRVATRCLWRAVERVGGGAPHRVMRRRAVRLERLLVAIDLVEVVGIPILLHVEAEAMRSSRSEPSASTSIAFRKRSRPSGLTRTFTHIAIIRCPPTIFLSASAGAGRHRGRDRRGRRSDTIPARSSRFGRPCAGRASIRRADFRA
jgi:hypothetical protein